MCVFPIGVWWSSMRPVTLTLDDISGNRVSPDQRPWSVFRVHSIRVHADRNAIVTGAGPRAAFRSSLMTDMLSDTVIFQKHEPPSDLCCRFRLSVCCPHLVCPDLVSTVGQDARHAHASIPPGSIPPGSIRGSTAHRLCRGLAVLVRCAGCGLFFFETATRDIRVFCGWTPVALAGGRIEHCGHDAVDRVVSGNSGRSHPTRSGTVGRLVGAAHRVCDRELLVDSIFHAAGSHQYL